MTQRLERYRSRRDPARTPEPVPGPGTAAAAAVDHRGDDQAGRGGAFVVQEHHARSLHWDFRLERDGVLVSWAVPKGLPMDPAENHLARQTEDHPLEYASFAGTIPAGQYGGGTVTVWDTGTYRLEKWTEREVKVVLAGARVQGRYVLFRTRGEDWMVHRMDPSPPGWQPVPADLRPMLAVAGVLPPAGPQWADEIKWDGVRALGTVRGGRLKLASRNGNDVTSHYPELAGLGGALGSQEAVLDGEVVAFDSDGRPDFGRLQARMHVARPSARLLAEIPVTYLAFDLLHLDGRSLLALPYSERRALLEALPLPGPACQVPQRFDGDGSELLAASRAQGLEGIVAKRLDSPYLPGRRSEGWVKVKHGHRQSTVVIGWKPGAGAREGQVGSLLLAVHGPAGLVYAGHVGTGFTAATLQLLDDRLAPLRTDSPAAPDVPREHARHAVWVRPDLVADVEYTQWTRDGRLRHPSFKGLRDDLDPATIEREP